MEKTGCAAVSLRHKATSRFKKDNVMGNSSFEYVSNMFNYAQTCRYIDHVSLVGIVGPKRRIKSRGMMWI